MPVGLNSAFDIARKGLTANLAGLNVTGHNIANVNTEGFSRQRVDLQTSLPIKFPPGIFGTGVDVGGVNRMRNELIDRQFRRQNEDMGTFEVAERILKQLETIFNEPSETGGIRKLLSKFFDDFQELASEPESATMRTVVRESATVLVESLQRFDQQMTILSNDIGGELDQDVNQVNELADKIAGLNVKISALKNVGESPNDLMDDRDRAINQLSKLINIHYNESSSGAINIAAGNRSLVSDGLAVSIFRTVTTNDNGNLITTITGESDDIPLVVNRGEIQSLLNVRDTTIPKYREKMDQLISHLISTVNSLHKNGVGLRGSSPNYPIDNNFFTGTDTGSIGLSDEVKRDIKNIASSERIESVDSSGNVTVTGEPGNNKIALEIARLKTTMVMESNTATYDDFLSGVVGSLGIEAKDATDRQQNQKNIITQLQNLQDSYSGVSLDEEMTKLIQFQRAYQASARVVTVVDDLFQTLLGMAPP